MSDAEKRQKVIDGLELCLEGLSDICPYKDSDAPGGCKDELMHDALLLLKAQEPRVMKVGDVRSWVNSDRTAREPVIIEMRNGVCAWIVDDEVRELKGAEDLTSELYGKTWRCWTSRPTDEQREATPWQ